MKTNYVVEWEKNYYSVLHTCKELQTKPASWNFYKNGQLLREQIQDYLTVRDLVALQIRYGNIDRVLCKAMYDVELSERIQARAELLQENPDSYEAQAMERYMNVVGI